MFVASKVCIGTFQGEALRRFIGKVTITNQKRECYISSSCHLSPLINLTGKTVLLRDNSGERTQYTLYALVVKNNKVLLDVGLVNNLVLDYYQHYSSDQILREHKIGLYKSDLFLPLKKLVIEVKAVVSDGKDLRWGTRQGDRAIKQLQILSSLLDRGFKVKYCIVCMNPQTRHVHLHKADILFAPLQKCITKGMRLQFFQTCWKGMNCYLRPLRYHCIKRKESYLYNLLKK